ncbi:prespore-specific protein [Cavenderia fasciculata]|uniref:Prespore-specific protein n=1 Tax=Cavenderia fasciculata TaxID=261658 RepID=F4PHK0_CACFS|nr:prespore-specific protein [Cavenderia fasciculata]EGG25184.1 prespore-specific protein [Cavenderia fasciculata]|eukprot:XP_004363035.1 prespore-specific protein [Cavenderia fasciculata]
MATTMHCGSDPLIKNYFMSLLVGGDGRGGNGNTYNSNALEILQVFNAIEFEFAELQKPRIFELIPVLEASCLVNYRDCQIVNLPLVRKHLESDPRFTNVQDIDRELEICARLNATITLVDSKTRALEGWKLFVNEALLQVDTLISMNEMIPLTLLQRLVMEFSNEKYPITCGISLGYTILTLFYVLKMKKDTFQLSNNFNDILESKVKGIFEGLIQTILRSSYQPIRGIAYTCIIKYLTLTHSFDQNKTNDLNGNNTTIHNIKSIEKHNILLLNKVDDRFVRLLISDCSSFSGGWKIAATSCMELLVALDGIRSNKTLRALDDRNAIVSIIGQCTNTLQRWEQLDARDLRVYDSQMSLLIRVAQNIDGIRLLMASNIVASFSACSFLSHVPSDLSMSPYASLIIPLFRLLVSLFNFPHERVDIYAQVQSLMAEHSDLFKFILQDAHPPSNTSLTILQLSVHLLSQNSKLIAQNYQSEKTQAHFTRFHSAILSLFGKYSRHLKSKIKEDRDDSNLDEDEIASYQSVDFTNQKEQPTIFDVEMNHLITLICRDIILYCRRVSIIQNSKFGSACFGSTIKSTLLSGNGTLQNSVLPSLDVPIKYMKECLVSYSKSLEIVEFLKHSIENVDNLSNYQLKQILHDDQSYQDLEVSQRNQMVIKKLTERLAFRHHNSDLLKEVIETLLLVIVTHAYHFTVSVQGLFIHGLMTNASSLSNNNNNTTSPLLSSSTFSSSFVSQQQPILNLNELSNNNNNNNKKQQDIFLNNNNDQQQSSTGKFMSSVFSYLKGVTNNNNNNNNNTNNNNNNNSQVVPYNNAAALNQSSFNNSSFIKSMIQQQQEGELSPVEAKDFLTKLWTSFDTEVPAFHKRLFDCLHNMPNKTLMIELLIKKLQDIFNK